MKVYCYPADQFACGSFRVIWPAQILAEMGHDVEVVTPDKRQIKLALQGNRVMDIQVPPDADVIVFQRITHVYITQVITLLRSRGIATVVDIDDDLSAVHPSNPAWQSIAPRNFGRELVSGKINMNSWHHLNDACRASTLVTVSTPALLERYARHGRGALLRNCLPDHYYGVEHNDSAVIGWPASLASHPNDPDVVGPAVARLVSAGAEFRVVGDPTYSGRAFGLAKDPPGGGVEDLYAWPVAVAQLGIGIAPLADTRFNGAKSWLKPLEMSAVGVPWVGSDRPEYQALHGYGAGLIADHPRRWYSFLAKLHASESMRRDVADAGRAVADQLKLRDHAWRWWEAWTYARQLQDASSRAPVH